jgi:hypothetical protein
MLSVTAARGGIFQWRERLAEQTSLKIDRGMAAPYWLKLKRDGDVFTASKSPNGKQWFVVDTLTMQATRELYVGMAVVGVRENVLNQSVFEQVEEGPSLRNRWFVPQVELQGGSTQMGYIARMDDSAIHFDGAMPKTPVSTLNVANVRFQPLPPRWAPFLNAGRMGVLLRSGEFIDGECRSIEEGRVILSSVPLGLCRYDVNSEVIALVLPSGSTTVLFSTWCVFGSTSRSTRWKRASATFGSSARSTPVQVAHASRVIANSSASLPRPQRKVTEAESWLESKVPLVSVIAEGS